VAFRSHRSRHHLVAGAAAGLIGGLLLGVALQLLGQLDTGRGWALHLLLSGLLGAGFGVIFRYQPYSYASTISSGLLYGLLWWVVGPLTLLPLLLGQQPSWSLSDASAAFPTLVGYLLYGGVMGGSFSILVSLSRNLYPTLEPVVAATEPTTRIVIIGGGFGGVSAAQRLEQLFRHHPDVDIMLVSHSNYLLFTPMLAEVAASALEAQHISAPIRAALTRTNVRGATVEAIDPHAQTIQIRPSPSAPLETVTYDQLIVALGSVPHYHDLPGLEASSFPLKTLHDATRLRNHVIALLERAEVEPNAAERQRQLTFVVAGGGFAGAEIIAELFDLVHSVVRYYPNVAASDLRFVLVHSRERILPELSAELADYALQKLQARGIEVRLNTRVARATPDAVLFNDGSQLLTYTLVWTAGNQPHPLLNTWPGERNRAGAIVVEPTLQAKGLANVWAVGDNAYMPDPDNDGRPYPPTAQHATRAGKVVAENVAAALHGTPLKPFRFRTLGMLVALGRRTAVADVRGWRFSGLLAWVLWRAVYLSKLPGLEKKLRVALDWTIDLFFPRDIVVTTDTTLPTMVSNRGRNEEQRIARRRMVAPVEEE
jgi:NADH dehydrogenase